MSATGPFDAKEIKAIERRRRRRLFFSNTWDNFHYIILGQLVWALASAQFVFAAALLIIVLIHLLKGDYTRPPR